MDDRIRSLYIRVLRGKCDRGRGKSQYMRNVAKEIEWYYKYDEIKKMFNKDEYFPEDIMCGWTSSRMPGCYKWAKQFIVNKPVQVVEDLEEERKRKEEMEKRPQGIYKRILSIIK